MFCRRILICAIVIVGIFLIGCGGGSNESSPSEVSLRGGNTTLIMPLPFAVKNPPLDESGDIPEELKGIILKSERYQAGDNGIYLNATYSTFQEGLFQSLSEDELYEALQEEHKNVMSTLNGNEKFSNIQVSSNKNQVDGNPAIIATATYRYDGNDAKSIMVYTLHGDVFWRLIFDFRASDTKAADTVDNAVKNIKLQ